MRLAKSALSLLASKSLPGTSPILANLSERRSVGARGRIGLHELRQQREVGHRVHPVHLLAHGGLHVDGGIDRAGGRRIGLAVGTERDQLELVLERVHGRVVFRRAGAVDAAKDPYDAGRRLVLLDTGGKRARPSRAGDRVGLRAGAGGALAGDLEHVGPAVEHGHQEVAFLHVGDAQHPRFLADIEKGSRVERIGVGRRHVAKGCIGILTQLDQLPHRGARAFRGCDVRYDPTGHLHGDERIAVDVGVGGEPEVLEAFADPGKLAAPIRTCEPGNSGAGEQAESADRGGASCDRHSRVSSCAQVRVNGPRRKSSPSAHRAELAKLLRAHVPLPLGSLLLRHLASFEESWQVVRSPCCPRELPGVIS